MCIKLLLSISNDVLPEISGSIFLLYAKFFACGLRKYMMLYQNISYLYRVVLHEIVNKKINE